jgi:hypothetical protein
MHAVQSRSKTSKHSIGERDTAGNENTLIGRYSACVTSSHEFWEMKLLGPSNFSEEENVASKL